MPPTLRTCNTCEIQKNVIDNFKSNRNTKHPDTYRHRCIDCDKIFIKNRNRQYYLKHADKIKEKVSKIYKLKKSDS